MEELLNKLIEKGWKPRWLETKRFDGEMYYAEFFEHYSNWTMLFDGVEYSIRELVSKESWLWQFVCWNEMVVLKFSSRKKNARIGWEYTGYDTEHIVMDYTNNCEWTKYEYRLIESALKDESEIEDFLLNSIKVD